MHVEKISKAAELIENVESKIHEQLKSLRRLKRAIAQECRQWIEDNPDHELVPEVAKFLVKNIEDLAFELYGYDFKKMTNHLHRDDYYKVQRLREDWLRYRRMAA